MTQLLHQLGHRYQWNLDCIQEENIGDGVIIGPRYMERSFVQNLPLELRKNSIFDPQFFLPSSGKGKLPTYPFFPQVVSGDFSTTEWDPEFAHQCAANCVDFQIACDFKHLVIPTRVREGMPSDYIEEQSISFVEPFINEIRSREIFQKKILQLTLTDQMLKDDLYRRDILNWVTGIREIDGVYLIYYLSSRRKQIFDIDFLYSVLLFISDLKKSGMIVLLGYQNTESILMLISNPDAVTMGSYENLRMFGLTPYQNQDDIQIRGPNARIYISRLLQWVEYQYIGAINRVINNPINFYHDNKYKLAMFEPTYNWNFSKPEPYRHYFLSFADQFYRLASFEDENRIDAIREECEQALREFELLEEKGIVFDSESGGRHLPAWITALNLMSK